jgi:redox-sensitive bicupin YhaK (pirin superfamily)
VQIASGAVTLNGQTLVACGGAAVSDEPRLEIGADTGSAVLLFDLS